MDMTVGHDGQEDIKTRQQILSDFNHVYVVARPWGVLAYALNNSTIK